MKSSLIWEKLRTEGKDITTSEEVKELAEKMDKGGESTLYYLQEEDYLSRILRGIFYVKSLEERKQGIQEYSIYELVAMALKEKGVENWYFALETALKFNNMTHEYYNIDYALTESYRTPKVIEIIGQKFKFFKRREQHFSNGVTKKEYILYSDPEKTVLDLIYRAYLNDKKNYSFYLREFEDQIEMDKIKTYLEDYSKSFRKKVVKEI